MPVNIFFKFFSDRTEPCISHYKVLPVFEKMKRKKKTCVMPNPESALWIRKQ